MKEENEKENQEVRGPGPGRILREERERRGLTYQDMSETTRLRPSVIEAIENEAWDSLPSPAFARGFMKTYAKALSLDATSILEVYGRKPVLNGELLRAAPAQLRRRRKGPFYVFCILAAVASFALWKTYAPKEQPSTVTNAKPPIVAEPAKNPASMHTTAADVKQPGSAQATAPAPPASIPSPEMRESIVEEKPAPEPAQTVVKEKELVPGQHTLKGRVSARTWVKIYVDDLNPREYMFQPGQQPEWTGSRGFYLIIGNAGGIDLEWNGQGVKTGSSGQVVRIRLPEHFKHRVEGN
ncbi:MAG: helix-turn-helix domain-containing protein [Desulfobacteraceae bacterium]|nr:MAG: helix-turn-helix domain-containing protein [Desulfobacteraceae bacterium]